MDLEKVSRRTPGFTGADLQNLMNEAAILAARRGLTEISKEEIADALERIIAGPEKKGAVMTDKVHWGVLRVCRGVTEVSKGGRPVCIIAGPCVLRGRGLPEVSKEGMADALTRWSVLS